jgi:cyclopropane-fatty-acyl-phospholipid synthase
MVSAGAKIDCARNEFMIVSSAIEIMERGLSPDSITRWGMRQLLGKRIHATRHFSSDGVIETKAFVDATKDSPIAIASNAANDQHYEMPPDFFRYILGPRRKYSCCFWSDATRSLAQAEEDSLQITCEHANIVDGDHVLELGCGWGSLTLYIAENFPQCRVMAISNSHHQRMFIEQQLEQLHAQDRVQVITADMKEFETTCRFDKIVSVEMLEHMRNYPRLLQRIATWMVPQGLFFAHVFCHRKYPYIFETTGAENWMGRYFFTGGTMPSFDLFRFCSDDLEVRTTWSWDGSHYARTLNAWLRNLDLNRNQIIPILISTYGKQDALRWLNRWRMFLMACAELFAYRCGTEWFVAHYQMQHARSRPT